MIDVDHRMKPNGRDINEDGIRSRRISSDYRDEDLNIVFLGDSFVYGWCLQDHQAMPQQFERLVNAAYPERRVKAANFGWPSASPLLSLRQLKDIGEKYKPDVIVLCIDMTDVFDDILYHRGLRRRGPFRYADALPGTMFVTTSLIAMASRRFPCTARLFERLAGFPADHWVIVKKPLSETRRHYAHITANIGRIYDYCRTELKARFILTILPRSFQYSDRECPDNLEKACYSVLGPYCLEPFKYFESLGEKVDYPVLSLLRVFQLAKEYPLYFTRDFHWNERGCKVAAQAILNFLERRGCFREDSSACSSRK